MQQSPGNPVSPVMNAGEDGLVRAMSVKYSSARASQQGSPAFTSNEPGTNPHNLRSPHMVQTPHGRRHDPYRSSDALHPTDRGADVAPEPLLPTAAAAAPAGLRAKQQPPIITRPAPDPVSSDDDEPSTRKDRARNRPDSPIDDSDSDGDAAPVTGTTDRLLQTSGTMPSTLSPGAAFNPNAVPFANRSSPGGPPVRKTPGARSMDTGAAGTAPPPYQQQRSPNFMSAFGQQPGAMPMPQAMPSQQHQPSAPPAYAPPPQQPQAAPTTSYTQPGAMPFVPQQQQQQAPPLMQAPAVTTADGTNLVVQQQQQVPAPAPMAPTSTVPSAAAPRRGDGPITVTSRDLEMLVRQAAAARPADGSGNQGVDVSCPPGFTLTVYNGDISQHFNIPSESVQVTRGSIKYVDHHARYGAQTRFRFQLCHNYLLRKCPKLSECSYIHAMQLPAPTQVHLNPFAPRRLAADRHGHSEEVPASLQDDPTVVEQYETLPAGFVLTVHAPNAGNAAKARNPPVPQRIPSEKVLATVGAQTALEFLRSGGRRTGDAPTAGSRPRHCAHYQFKRLCNLGRDCHFIHSKVPFADADRIDEAPPGNPTAPVPQQQQQQFQQQFQQQTGAAQGLRAAPRRSGAKPIPREAFAPGAVSQAEAVPAAPAQGNTEPMTVSGGQAPAPPSPEGASFLAGMHYAMSLLRVPGQPAQDGNATGAAGSWQAVPAGSLVGPTQMPVQSPPSVGVSPFAAGVTTGQFFGANLGGPALGPLSAVPAQQQQPAPAPQQ